MKRKHIILVMLLVVTGLFTMQSCSKEDQPTPVIYKAAVPANPTPAVDAVVPLAGTTYTLTWEGTATTNTWDVYVGASEDPELAQSGVTGNSYTFTTTTGGHFYWYVITKDANNMVSTGPVWSFFINSAPTVPVLTTPEANAIDFPVNGTLEWTSSDAEEDALTYDVYLGTTDTPELVVGGLEDASYSPAMEASTKYYWKVVAKDPHGAATSSAVGSFTTGLPPADPIAVFTGNYLCDEPAENYSYDVSFEMTSSTTIETANYWNSGWVGEFTVDLDNLTYSMPYTTWTSGYSGVESGIVDPTTGKMVGTYTIFKDGANIEQGVHTYTKY